MRRWYPLIIGVVIGSLLMLTGITMIPKASARSVVQTEKIQALMPLEENASVPKIAYQGRLTDPAGTPKADGGYQMLFSLYAVSNGGSPLWSETKSVTLSKGLFSTLLGDSTALDLTLFDGQDLFLGITIGSDAETTPRQPIAHVAYAIHARTAANAINAENATNAVNATNADTATHAANAADADLLDGQDSTAFSVTNHNHDPQYVNAAGPDDMSASNATYVLNIKQSGTGDGITAFTAATTPGEAGVEGTSGTASGTTINGSSGILGDSKAARGVIGISLDNDGILGFSTNGAGIYGQSLNNIGVRAFSQSGNALQVEGKAQVNGDLAVTGNISNKMAPIALGFINSDGTTAVGAGSFTSLWNGTSSRYEITITGHSYHYASYVTVVSSSCANFSLAVSSVSGKLLVFHYNSAGAATQCGFQFVTYKP